MENQRTKCRSAEVQYRLGHLSQAAGLVPTMPYDNFEPRSLNRRFPHHPLDLVFIKGQPSSSHKENAKAVQRSSQVANTHTPRQSPHHPTSLPRRPGL